MKQLAIGILLLSLMGSLTACHTIATIPNTSYHASPADYVKIGTQVVPGACEYRGVVDSGSVEYMPLERHDAIQAAQMRVIKNQAYYLSANAIIITSHRTSYYTQYIVPTGETYHGIDEHAMVGQAFYCPAPALRQIRPYESIRQISNEGMIE